MKANAPRTMRKIRRGRSLLLSGIMVSFLVGLEGYMIGLLREMRDGNERDQ